jgi:iron(III) transport system substrate-binding protein
MPAILHKRRLLLFLATGLALGGLLTGCSRKEPRVVLYCSQDKEFAEPIFDAFKSQNKLGVAVRYDTEANKSVSLYRELVAEKNRPRCDVYWNNEIVSTIRLQKQGLLEPYDSPSAAPYPAWARAKDHTWHAFAARARILIVNTKLVKAGERPTSLLDLTHEKWKGKVVISKPQFGTGATQVACLFDVLGPEGAKKYYRDLKNNGLQLAPGNKQVAEWVGQGRTPTGQEVAVGVTDTDDALEEVREGRPVVIVFPDRKGSNDNPKLGTLFIPNTLMVIKGAPNGQGARKLVDYLLSAEVETKLAEGPSGQIPLNPDVKAKLPAQIETPATAKPMAVDWERAAELWDEAQAFIIKEISAP